VKDTTIIGFGHKARHGKDTAVKTVIEKFGGQYDIRRYAFADPLRIEMYDALLSPMHPYWEIPQFGADYLKLPHPRNPFASEGEKLAWYEEHRAELGKHPQWYGTEFRRAQDPFYWVKRTKAQIEKDSPQFALISDMRFVNEFMFVKAFKGWTVKVSRHGFVDPTRDPNHPSETALDKALFDFEINVLDGEVEQLKKDAVTVFELIIAQMNPVQEQLLAA
jgi:hypothetical protein